MFVEINVPNFSDIIIVSISTLVIFGHNLWLVGKKEPTRVRISANTGDNFPESDSAVKPERVADFRLVSSSGSTPIENYLVENHSLVADVQNADNKSFCVALALHAHPITLEAKKFAGYIAEENAQEFVKPNFVSETATEPQRESYTKFAKVLIENASVQPGDISNLVAGHRLEIVPQVAPSSLGGGGKLSVKILFEDEPIAGLRVSSGCEELNGGKYSAHTITNENGLAEIKIENAGHWFVRTHFIRPHADKENFDWESFWASVTFRIQNLPSKR